MKYTKLGNSDLNVSRICMGCMGLWLRIREPILQRSMYGQPEIGK